MCQSVKHDLNCFKLKFNLVCVCVCVCVSIGNKTNMFYMKFYITVIHIPIPKAHPKNSGGPRVSKMAAKDLENGASRVRRPVKNREIPTSIYLKQRYTSIAAHSHRLNRIRYE